MANKLTISAVGLLSLLAAGTFAQTATTIPVGFIKYTITGGTPAAPFTTAIAIPLHDVGGVSGISAGVISSVGSTTVNVNSAGWTPGALAQPAIPYALCVKSGAAAGATLTISGNTATALTFVATDLVALGVAAGDSFEIIPLDTLFSFFGANTLIGGATAATADVVYLMAGNSWNAYYYNTTNSRWQQKTGSPADRNNTPLQPGSGMLIERRGATLDIVATGTVPSVKFRTPILNSGNTLIHSGFPTDVTLGALAIQDIVPGWVKNSSSTTADWLYVMSANSWTSYYHNGTNWRLTQGSPSDKSTVVIPAGTPILLLKKGAAAGTTDLQRSLPYSL